MGTPLAYSLSLQTVIAFYCADFVTGFFHWLEDTYGRESWGDWLYQEVVKPNIEHHIQPRVMTKGNYWSRVRISFMLATPLVLISIATFNWGVFAFSLFAANANELHCWSHRGDHENSWFVRFCQRAGIVQSRQAHAMHHRKPYSIRYCVMTPVLNPILDCFGFWRILENIAASFGYLPTERGQA
jgi:ubiquitin-conjugating enzyme E2 variant